MSSSCGTWCNKLWVLYHVPWQQREYTSSPEYLADTSQLLWWLVWAGQLCKFAKLQKLGNCASSSLRNTTMGSSMTVFVLKVILWGGYTFHMIFLVAILMHTCYVNLKKCPPYTPSSALLCFSPCTAIPKRQTSPISLSLRRLLANVGPDTLTLKRSNLRMWQGNMRNSAVHCAAVAKYQ